MSERTRALVMITALMLLVSGQMAWCLWVRSGAFVSVSFFLAYNLVTVYVWLPWSVRKRIHRW